MSATINGSMTIQSSFAQVSAALPGSPSISAPQRLQFVLQGNGTGQDQADFMHTRKYTLAATPLVLDLTNLLDVDNNAVNFARVRSIKVTIVDQTSGHTVLFGFATTTSNACTSIISNPGQLTIHPSTSINQGAFVLNAPGVNGYLVTSTSKLINFDPGSNTVVIWVEILGASV